MRPLDTRMPALVGSRPALAGRNTMSSDIVSQIEIPTNPSVLYVAKRGRECWLLQFRCAWCGKLHRRRRWTS